MILIKQCVACNFPKPGSKPEETKSAPAPSSGGFKFGSNAASEFKFGVQPTATSTVDKKSEPAVSHISVLENIIFNIYI